MRELRQTTGTRSRSPGARVLAVVLACVVPLSSQAADVQHLLPLGDDFVALRPAANGDPWSAHFTVVGDAAINPSGGRGAAGRDWVRGLYSARLDASVGFGHYLRGGIALPVHRVDRVGGPVEVALGDVLVHLTVATPGNPVGLRVEVESAGDGSPEDFSTQALAGGISGRVGRWGGQLLARVQSEDLVRGLPIGTRLEGAVGYRLPLRAGFAATLELFGATPIRRPRDTRELPLEALVGVDLERPARTRWRVAWGLGLSDGLGTPSTRVLVSGAVRVPGLADVDEDGLRGPFDRCPAAREDRDGFQDRDGCPEPDNDADGIVDVHDSCPDVPETANGWKDDDGCPDTLARWVVEVVGPPTFTVTLGDQVLPDQRSPWVYDGPPGSLVIRVDAEGFRPGMAQVVLEEARSRRTLLPLDARPMGRLSVEVVAADGSPVDATVQVDEHEHSAAGGLLLEREDVGIRDVTVHAAGRVSQSRRVEILDDQTTTWTVELVAPELSLVGNRLVVGGTPLFGVDEDALADPGAIERIATWMEVHPEVRLLRVEGHADPEGPSEYNLGLSARRAEGVATALQERGIAPERLQVIASGEAFTGQGPIRQVTFTVLVWSDDPDR